MKADELEELLQNGGQIHFSFNQYAKNYYLARCLQDILPEGAVRDIPTYGALELIFVKEEGKPKWEDFYRAARKAGCVRRGEGLLENGQLVVPMKFEEIIFNIHVSFPYCKMEVERYEDVKKPVYKVVCGDNAPPLSVPVLDGEDLGSVPSEEAAIPSQVSATSEEPESSPSFNAEAFLAEGKDDFDDDIPF